MGMMINRRRACGGKSLPYDYEVEYLESDGYQWIDTGIIPKYQITSVEFQFSISDISKNVQAVFGSRNDIVGSYRPGVYCYYLNTPNYLKRLRFDWVYTEQKSAKFSQVLTANTFYTVIGYPNGNTLFDNVTYSNLYPKDDCLYTMLIFNFNNVGVNTNQGLVGRVKYVKIMDNGVFVRDFIPVVKDNIGYMYDKVSGQLFGNAGTGSFIVGPRVS